MLRAFLSDHAPHAVVLVNETIQLSALAFLGTPLWSSCGTSNSALGSSRHERLPTDPYTARDRRRRLGAATQGTLPNFHSWGRKRPASCATRLAAIQQQPISHRGLRSSDTRQAMSEIGGVMPENMPVPDSIARREEAAGDQQIRAGEGPASRPGRNGPGRPPARLASLNIAHGDQPSSFCPMPFINGRSVRRIGRF
jgi:hypothetical protein